MMRKIEYLFYYFAIVGIVFSIMCVYFWVCPYYVEVSLDAYLIREINEIAALLTLSRIITCSDWTTVHIKRRIRMIASMVPAFLAAGILTYEIGLQNVLHSLYSGKGQLYAVIVFYALIAASIVFLFFLWLVLERKYNKKSEEYNKALEKYKIH